MRIPTPLKYPGSKAWLVRKMLLSVPTDIAEFVSPFFGSGVIELNIAQRGVKIHGYDLCPRLTNFWQHWLDIPERIDTETRQLLRDTSPEKIKDIKTNIAEEGIEAAIQYYLINRLSYSGKIHDGEHTCPYKIIGKDILCESDGRPVFPQYLNKITLRKYKRLPISVEKQDFSVSINRHPDALIYCDPPYMNREKDLYNVDSFNHEQLREDLEDKPHWITSYQDKPEIRKMYRDFKIITLKMKSTFRVNGKNPEKTELLIFSNALATRLQL